jgi:hypothetical protein
MDVRIKKFTTDSSGKLSSTPLYYTVTYFVRKLESRSPHACGEDLIQKSKSIISYFY